MRIFEYLEQNIDVIKTLVRIGAVPPSYLNYFKIYSVYRTSHNLESKMSRYYFTADIMKIGTTTVRESVKIMESRLPKSCQI